MADQDDKNKPEKQQSGGRPGTKFMERPKPGQQKDPSQQQGNIPPADIEEEQDVEEETGERQQQQGQQQQGKQQQQGQQQQQQKKQQEPGKDKPGSN